ncbi:MAG TPA: hypothetical protein DCZ10_09095, partial [Pelotomaculum sp.]|nr:hypothetical protein [Pelotomaculum sp.]
MSFRIGRIITFIPRKIRGGIRCHKEHGLRYTIFHIGYKFTCLKKKSERRNYLNKNITDLNSSELIKMFNSKVIVGGNPLVSVIIPVYNAEKYLEECVSSVRNQTLRNIEIILVDDGSTDNSLNIIYEYAKQDSRIKVLCQKQKFAGVARNNGLDQAHGDYVIFLDS